MLSCHAKSVTYIVTRRPEGLAKTKPDSREPSGRSA
jgi:hypothetical protein